MVIQYYTQDKDLLNDAHIYKNTSSTAQGGGGTFKKGTYRSGCCESQMSEQKHWPTD